MASAFRTLRFTTAFVMALTISGAAFAQDAQPAATAPVAPAAAPPSQNAATNPVAAVPPGAPQPLNTPGANAAAAAPAGDVALTATEASALGNVEKAVASHVALDPSSAPPRDMKSLFYTTWQYALLVEARQSFRTRPPGGGDTAKQDPGPREISLGGISFTNSRSWTVWLNNQRLKPDALPPQIMSFHVTRDYVDLKWFDNASNLIYPIRLHPHERFNLDNRIFLPGAGQPYTPAATAAADAPKSGT